MENRRVVITGLGTLNALGNSVEETWKNIKDGVVGISSISKFDTKDYKCKVAGEVKDFDQYKYLAKKEAKRMSMFSKYAINASLDAWIDSGLNSSNIDPFRVGTFVTTGVGGLTDCEDAMIALIEGGPKKISSLFIPMMISNIASGNVAIKTGAMGPCLNIVSACASSNNALGEAFNLIRDKRAEAMIVGGAEAPISMIGVAGFMNLRATTECRDPLKASIPFDSKRSGFVMGEGAGVLILEELTHAQNRGAKIHGEIVGYGSTCDAYHMTAPRDDGAGAICAMREALKDGELSGNQIGYINAHGTSTILNDKIETMAIKEVFGESVSRNIPISSTKSMTGHLLGAASAIEAIISIMALKDSYIPPTAGLEKNDPDCDLDYVPKVGRKKNIEYAMSNSFGFGGHNSSIIFKKWES